MRRALRHGQPTDAAIGWRLFRGALPVGVGGTGLMVCGNVAVSFLGHFALQKAATVLVLGSQAGLVTSCVCLPLLLGLLAAGRQRSADGAAAAEVIVADLADSP